MIGKPAILILLCNTFLYACNSNQQKQQEKDNIVISTDKKALEKIINLDEFNPVSVQFVYKPVVEQNERDLVPGPTDYRLEAVLYFNKTARVNRKGCSPFEVSEIPGNEFNFSWLPDGVRKELTGLNHTALKGYKASCFYKGALMHGAYNYLEDKIILFLFTM